MDLRHFGIKTTVTAWALNQFELVPPRELTTAKASLMALKNIRKGGGWGSYIDRFLKWAKQVYFEKTNVQ